jgi:hypothetical protein
MARPGKRALALATVLASALVVGTLARAGPSAAQSPPAPAQPATATPGSTQPGPSEIEALQTRYYMTIPGSSRPVS